MSGAARRTARAVVDLGFGDAGKGLMTDYLVRRYRATAVVRFNGGAQAGHNVVTANGRHHTFAQFGAGTFARGVRTFLSRHFALHPSALLVEAEALARRGVTDALARLVVNEKALVVTPFHQAANRIRESTRGEARHGSCGVGVGEAVGHALASPSSALRAGDLGNRALARDKLERIRIELLSEMKGLADSNHSELSVLSDSHFGDAYLDQIAPFIAANRVVGNAQWELLLSRENEVVFEGAQGVLLDELHGFHPHTTWSNCTFANALELAAGFDEVIKIGVLRAISVRHGAGPFPTEDRAAAPGGELHNAANAWQGAPRHGWFDNVLARYALDVVGGVDALAITHLDSIDKSGRFRNASQYRSPLPARLPISTLDEPTDALTRLVAGANPVLEEVAAEGAVARIEEGLGARVGFTSRGPTAGDVSIR